MLDKEIGKMQSDIEYLKKNDEELKDDIKGIKSDLSDIKHTLATVGGGWRVIVMFGTFCAFVGGFLVKLIPFIPWR